MLKIGNANNFRRTFAGLALIAGPLLGLIGALFVPPFVGGMEGELSFIAEHPERWLISDFLTLLAFILMIPAVLGLIHLLRDRLVALGHIGSGLVVLGVYFHAAVIGYALVEIPLVERGGEITQMIVFTDQMYEHSAFTMVLLPFLGFYLGWLILAVALWRARVVPLWVAAGIVAGLLSEFLGPEALSPELMYILLLVSFGWIGLRMLRMSDVQWAYTSTETFEANSLVSQPAQVS